MVKKIVPAVVVVLMLAVLIALVPVEQKRAYYEKYGQLAVDAETDSRAAFIIENYDNYPQELLDLGILRNDYDFLYEYFEHKDDYKTMSFTDEELNSKLPPKLYMNDHRWCYENLAGEPIKYSGCALVSLTMANIYLTHTADIDPVIAAKAVEQCQAVGIFGGLDADKAAEVCEYLGFDVKEYYCRDEIADEEAEQLMKDIIDSGHACFLALYGEKFGGHSVLAVAYNDSGFILNDPASEERSETVWSFDELKTEIYSILDLSKG